MDSVECFSDLVVCCHDVFNTLDGTSSPGFPYTNVAPTYKSVRDDDTLYDGYTLTDTIVLSAAFRVLKMLEAPDGLSAVDLALTGVACLNVPFVKSEPNKESKRGTPRIVISRSACDRIANEVLFKIDHPGLGLSSYCKGYGLTQPKLSAVHSYLVETRSRYFGPLAQLVKSDVKGWETSYSAQTMAWTMFVYSLCSTSKYDVTSLYQLIGHSIMHACFLLEDGSVVVKSTPGGQVSGHFLTTETNSPGRAFHAADKGNIAMTMGDDTVEWTDCPTDLASRYKKTGLEVRDVEDCTIDRFEFCSSLVFHGPDGMGYAHTSYGKSIYKMLTKGWSLFQATTILKAGFSDPVAAEQFKTDMTELSAALKSEFPELADFSAAEFDAFFEPTVVCYEQAW